MIQRPQNRPPQSGPNPPGTNGNQPRNRLTARGWLFLIIFAFIFNAFFYWLQVQNSMSGSNRQTTLTYSAFITQVHAGNIKDASVQADQVTGDFKKPLTLNKTTYTRFSTTMVTEVVGNAVSVMQSNGVNVTLKTASPPAWLTILSLLFNVLPILFLVGLFVIGGRQARQQAQGMFGFGKGRGKLYTEERPSTTFKDVAGVDAAKAELAEIVDFLKDHAKYERLGAHIPKGALLVGPPGTGKTLLARAVAGEANVPFLAISATEFVEMFVGVGASRVRDLFDRAKAVAPAIVFIDEIDAIGGQRGGSGFGSNDERDQTLNQLLVSMDGFEPNEAVIIISATNRPDTLDVALLRPGRFDRQVVVDPPDRKGREAILRIHTQNIPLATDVDLGDLARSTPGMSGADLANLANEAALTAARNGETTVRQMDFYSALDRITLGSPTAALVNEDERRTVAYHEGGHALVAYLLPNTDPVNRITITPRGRSLGVTQFLPIDDRRNYWREYLLNRMAVGLGGRSAEEVAFSDITSGAENDLQMVTQIARQMVSQLGMDDELGPTYFGGAGDNSLAGRSSNPWAPKAYSDETAARIDTAVERLVERAHDRARTILRDNRAALDAIAQTLMRDESIEAVGLAAIVAAHPGLTDERSESLEPGAVASLPSPVT